ncbi:hypothetical protein ACO0K9_23340 [Undibacterium sp. Ji50W]|uniref:hypothetical protein n=1 Tax=Undibacterium sp. Ji50W TaxID=3413041 RepID=UPI003BEFF7D3
MSEIILERVFGLQGRILFDTHTGCVKPTENSNWHNVCGNSSVLESAIAALYVEEGSLYFQLNANRWNIASPTLSMKYWHVFDKKSTIFSIEEIQIEFPSWWRDDPCFEQNIPEHDEAEDYLGYIFAVWQNKQLQLALINRWSSESDFKS